MLALFCSPLWYITCIHVLVALFISAGYNERIDSEVVIEAGRAGPFSTTLQCHLEQSAESLSMLVQGHVQVHVRDFV